VRVSGKMRRHPVEDHPYAVLVQAVNQIHEVLGSSIAAGGGKVPGRLVAPGT
jgi:hypothetical protein